VLTVPGATAAGRDTFGHIAAAKTGTANAGYYAAFAGYTPKLAAYVSVFNPRNPTGAGAMLGSNSCYRDVIGEECPGQMFGDNAPGATWQETFLHAALGRNIGFHQPPSSFFALGTGLGAPKIVGKKKPPKKGGPGGGGPGTGGPTPTPTPSH